MKRRIGYEWHLRQVMAERDLFATTSLVPLLAERGVMLSREQVYRLVVGTPERLNLATLAALCDILACAPSDLIEVVAIAGRAEKLAVGTKGSSASLAELRPRRARIVREQG